MTYSLHQYLHAAGVEELPDVPDFRMPLTPREHQVTGLNLALSYPRFGLFDDAGCVSGDTEFLTPTGWKRIDQYEPADQVCQYFPASQTASFCKPLRYVRTVAPYLVSIKGARGTDQLLSPDHKVLLRTNFANVCRGGDLRWVDSTAENILEAAEKNPEGRSSNSKIPTVFSLASSGSRFLDDASLRVMVAVIADGHFPNKSNRVLVRLKKGRKRQRLHDLLQSAEIEYTCRPCTPEGFYVFSFLAPRREKEFTEAYWRIPKSQREIVYEEFPHWDGSAAKENRGPSFSSTSKASADFIQFVCVSTGHSSSLGTASRGNRSIEYSVRVRGSSGAFVMPRHSGITRVKGSAKVYCFTVPSGYLVLRRNGYVFVTGNCGKSLIMQAYAAYYMSFGNRVLGIMPPILVYQFAETMDENYEGYGSHFRVHKLTQGPAAREKLFTEFNATGWPDLLLMSYEMFSKLYEVFQENGYNVLMADEAQKLKGAESGVHARVYNYTEDDKATALLLATGSPIHNELVDGYALSRLLDRESYTSRRQFDRWHAIKKRFYISKRNKAGRMIQKRVSQIIGWKNEEELNKRLYRFARRVEKDKVLSLKEPTIIPVHIDLTPGHKALYETMANERMLEIGEDRVVTATESVQLREALMGIVCTPEKFSEKRMTNNLMVEVETLLDSIGQKNKVALYAHHNATVEALADLLQKQNPVLVYGGDRSSGAKNARAVKAFKTDPECRLLIAHPESGGVGLDLQKVCHHFIFVEPTAIPGAFLQVMSRFQRSGQEHAVICYLLQVNGTVYPSMVRQMLDRNDRAATVNLDATTFRQWVHGG